MSGDLPLRGELQGRTRRRVTWAAGGRSRRIELATAAVIKSGNMRAQVRSPGDAFTFVELDRSDHTDRRRLGRPGEVQVLGRSRGVVWSYRYESAVCQWFQVELTREQTVRSAGYGRPPECDKPFLFGPP